MTRTALQNSPVCENAPHLEKDGKRMTCIHCRTHWKIKDLIEQTQQPELYLKQILNGVAEFNKRGEHQGTWVLKDEYRRLATK